MKRNHIFSVRNLSLMAALVAMQIILARFLAIQASDILRISFETVPLALAGIWLGPAAGVIVAWVSDFVGMFLAGQGTYFPLIALGPMAYAGLCGWAARRFLDSAAPESRNTWKLAVIVALAGIVNAFVIGPFTTTLYSMLVMGNTTAFDLLLWTNFVGRFATKPITIAIDVVLVTAVHRTVYKPVIRRMLARA